jgi:hypothetical protein
MTQAQVEMYPSLRLAMNLFHVIRKISHLVVQKLERTCPCFRQHAQVDMFLGK